jgi:hypothetical protein
MRALILALLLAACSTPQAAQEALEAQGAGFQLTIRPNQMVLTLTESGERSVFKTPEPRYPRWNGSIYEAQNGAHRISVSVRDDRPCRAANAVQYPTTIEILFDRREMQGCGRWV